MEKDLELLRCSTMAMIFHCEQYDKENSLLPELKKHRNTITMMIEACEGKADSTSEKDLRVCNVVASAFFKVTFSYNQGNPSGGIPYWKEEIKVYEASNEDELNSKIGLFLNDDSCGYQKHKNIVNICKL